MGPIQSMNLCIAPAFYACQIDIFGPFKSYSSANMCATIKEWFLIFCCCTTGAIDIRAMEDYSIDSVVAAYIRLACRYGYLKYVLPDAGSQLVKSCEDMKYSFTDTKNRLFTEYDVDFRTCPVHGKVERKIKEVKKSVQINVKNERLSLIQWETLMHQISNSINNVCFDNGMLSLGMILIHCLNFIYWQSKNFLFPFFFSFFLCSLFLLLLLINYHHNP